MAFYRFTRACRNIIVEYLRSQLQEGGEHFDGSEYITLPRVTVSDVYRYDPRKLPAVVTDIATGGTRTLAFNQQVGQYTDTYGIYGERGQSYIAYGGRGDFDINLHCIANDRETMEKLTDLVAFTLVIGMGWIYYNKHMLLREVRFGGDGVDDKVGQEPVYFGNLVVPATADWRLIVPRDTISKVDIDVDLVTPDDPFTDPNNVVPGSITPIDLTSNIGKVTEDQSLNSKNPPLRPMRRR